MTWTAPTMTPCDRCGRPVSWQNVHDAPPEETYTVDATEADGRTMFCPNGYVHLIDGRDWQSVG